MNLIYLKIYLFLFFGCGESSLHKGYSFVVLEVLTVVASIAQALESGLRSGGAWVSHCGSVFC